MMANTWKQNMQIPDFFWKDVLYLIEDYDK